MPQPPNKPVMQDPREIVDTVAGIATIVSGCFTPVLRSRMGTHAAASYPISLIFMIAYAGFANCPELMLYLPVWFVLVPFRRLTASKHEHTRYQGFPWLCCLIPFVRTEYQGRTVEPWVCFFAGVFMLSYSPGIGQFLVVGWLSLFVAFATEVAALQQRKRAMHDARIEAAKMAELQKGGNGWN